MATISVNCKHVSELDTTHYACDCVVLSLPTSGHHFYWGREGGLASLVENLATFTCNITVTPKYAHTLTAKMYWYVPFFTASHRNTLKKHCYNAWKCGKLCGNTTSWFLDARRFPFGCVWEQQHACPEWTPKLSCLVLSQASPFPVKALVQYWKGSGLYPLLV